MNRHQVIRYRYTNRSELVICTAYDGGAQLSLNFSTFSASKRSRTVMASMSLFVALILSAGHVYAAELKQDYDQCVQDLAAAQLREDYQAVKEFADRAKRIRGELAGVPDEPDRTVWFKENEQPITQFEVSRAFLPYAREIEKRKWWRIGDDPRQATRPLRDIASVIEGCTFACQTGCDDEDKIEQMAKEAADYLMWAQDQAGRGVFPFPASQNQDDRAFQVASNLLAAAQRSDRLDDVVENGWIVDDLDEGGLQYDNGTCAVALLNLYRKTHDERLLESAEEAAKWAIQQPVVPNWNYNSFSVYLLAELYRETAREIYRDAAVKKARLGIYPGQLTSGARSGRWFDGHNARPTYHYLIVRSLVALVAALKPGSSEYQEAAAALELALRARNDSLASGAIVNVDCALEANVLLQQYLAKSNPKLIHEADERALRVVGGYCVQKARNGRMPVAPAVWGRFLAYSHRQIDPADDSNGSGENRSDSP